MQLAQDHYCDHIGSSFYFEFSVANRAQLGIMIISAVKVTDSACIYFHTGSTLNVSKSAIHAGHRQSMFLLLPLMTGASAL